MPAAYTLYDVLRHVVTQVPWPGGEPDRAAAVRSIDEAERLGIFGNMARDIECSHPELRDGVCVQCGRTIEVGHSPSSYYGPTNYRQGW